MKARDIQMFLKSMNPNIAIPLESLFPKIEKPL